MGVDLCTLLRGFRLGDLVGGVHCIVSLNLPGLSVGLNCWISTKTCHCKPNKPVLFLLLVSKDF